jgi:hypothetical protein
MDARMPTLFPASRRITAILYADGEDVDLWLVGWVQRFADAGGRIAGLVQCPRGRSGRARCAIEVELLPSRQRMVLSEDRGPGARGCRLDQGRLIEALSIVEAALPGADVLLLNRFGKVEAEGGGGRSVMAAAIMRQVPVVVAVPWRNVAAFRGFADCMAQEVTLARLCGGVEGLAEGSDLLRLPWLLDTNALCDGRMIDVWP